MRTRSVIFWFTSVEYDIIREMSSKFSQIIEKNAKFLHNEIPAAPTHLCAAAAG